MQKPNYSLLPQPKRNHNLEKRDLVNLEMVKIRSLRRCSSALGLADYMTAINQPIQWNANRRMSKSVSELDTMDMETGAQSAVPRFFLSDDEELSSSSNTTTESMDFEYEENSTSS